MGREYPLGYDYFRNKCYQAFNKQRHLTDPDQIEQCIKKGEYVVKELEALWMLRVHAK
jgi:hypothetical protein